MEDYDENSKWWVPVLIIVLIFVGLIIAGFATGTLKVYKGPSQQEKCEQAGGIYIQGLDNSCAFPPSDPLRADNN